MSEMKQVVGKLVEMTALLKVNGVPASSLLTPLVSEHMRSMNETFQPSARGSEVS